MTGEQTTAYQKSQDAARALMELRQAEQQRTDAMETAKAEHKQVARAWFNLLEELWPPLNTEEYWVVAHKRVNDVFNAIPSTLMSRLLLATMSYLEEVAKVEGGPD